MRYQTEIQDLDMGHYHISLLVDEDGHLTIGVKSLDIGLVVEVDEDLDTFDEKIHRFTTEKIENDYIKEEFGE